jgi:hypothetical protein
MRKSHDDHTTSRMAVNQHENIDVRRMKSCRAKESRVSSWS